MRIFKKITLVLVAWGASHATAQVTLDQLIEAGLNNTSIAGIKSLLVHENELTQQNIKSQFLPQPSLSGQATYQSDVTQVSIPIPGAEIDPLSLDQYKLLAEVNQVIYDGGLIKQKGVVQRTVGQIEQIQVDVELEKMRRQIIEWYFSILAIERKYDVLELKRENLRANLRILQHAYEQGAVLASEAKTIEAAELKLQQQQQLLLQQKTAMGQALSLLTKIPVSQLNTLEVPQTQTLSFNLQSNTYSDQLFEMQGTILEQQHDLQLAVQRPKLNLFLQGGYGKPGLNFLRNEFDTYYIMGVRAQWNLGSIYTRKNEHQINLLQRKKLATRQASFHEQSQVQIAQFETTIRALRDNLRIDDQLIGLYRDIRKTAEIQMANGAITSATLLEKINAEHEAQIQKILHELELIKTSYLLQHVTGNYLAN